MKNENEVLVSSNDGELIAREYLDECGCSQSLQGYFILTKVICFAAQYPAATSRELFIRYAETYDDIGLLIAPPEGEPAAGTDSYLHPTTAVKRGPAADRNRSISDRWRRIYNMARYCFLRAEHTETHDFFSFIRLGASRIYKEIYLKTGVSPAAAGQAR